MIEQYLKESFFNTVFKSDGIFIFCKWNLVFRELVVNFLKEKSLVPENFNNLENLHNEILDKSILDYEFDTGVNKLTHLLYDIDVEDTYHKFLHFFFCVTGICNISDKTC